MSLGLYMDVHVPKPTTRGLRRRGVDVLTAQEDGMGRALDPDLLRRAGEVGRILFSQDEDMLAQVVKCERAGEPFATLIFARQLDLSIGRCIADLNALAEAALPEDARGQVISSDAPGIGFGSQFGT
jgi:predicted nuclease of predicted toxin-antitoxin system